MYMFNNRITIESREILERYLNGFEYGTSGTSFSVMYMWRDINKFSWDIIGEYMCMSGISHLELGHGIIEQFLFPPLTATGWYDPSKLRETIYAAREIFEKHGEKFSIRLLPEHMIPVIEEALPGKMIFKDDRANHDYVYLKKDLIDLKGRKYHRKKNHLNYFHNNYEYEYVPLTSGMKDEVMRFINEFNARKNIPEHEMDMLLLEMKAMEDVFENIEKVGYLAGAIRMNDRIEALSVGGRLETCTVTEHVEKANIEYRGLYQAICNEFCKHLPEDMVYINREEDMDLPNLRKAKLSLKPVTMVKKYVACFKQA